MARRNSLNRMVGGVLLGTLLLLSACDKDALTPPTASNVPLDLQDVFMRYVAIGNSITAGMQGFGINDATQLEAYPVLLAQQLGLDVPTLTNPVTKEFNVPLMHGPGCPPPIINIFTQERIGGADQTTCLFRTEPIPEFINNLAFPGADVVETFDYYDPAIVGSVTDVFKTFLLGGRTQLEIATELQPTFVTVWIGNGDALDAIQDQADPGNASLYPDAAQFAAWYGELTDSLAAIGSIQGGVLIGAVQVTGAPYVSVGGAYFQAAQQIPTLTVDANCLATAPIPGSTQTASVLVPFHYGAVLMGQASAGVPTTLDCSVPQVITADEAAALTVTVAQYNAVIEQAADDLGWIYLDPNELLLQLALDQTAIRPFPAFSDQDPQHLTAPFGWALSTDGLHPSAAAHVVVANALIEAINTEYGTTIDIIPTQ
jgi:hypothetical protein